MRRDQSRMTFYYPLSYGRPVFWLVPLAVVCCLMQIMFAPSYGQDLEVMEAPAPTLGPGPVDPKRVTGVDKCVDCHASEYKHWLTTHHATETFDKLRTNEKARAFAEKLQIPVNQIAKNSICTKCHATQQIEQGRMRTIAGVSCESCHGAAGGHDGWLNLHAVYGPRGTSRENETEKHYRDRRARCEQRGQLRVADPFRLARACYQCHMVWDEKLVNVAGHPAGNDQQFEFLAWSTGEVRHNYHLDPSRNALVSTLWSNPLWRSDGRAGSSEERFRVMYIAGQLAQLYVGLVNRAKTTDTENSDFVDEMNSRIEDAQGLLDEMMVAYEDATGEKLMPLQRAVSAAIEIEDDLEDVDPTKASRLLQAAAKVEAAAAEFIEQYDGSELVFLDPDQEGFLPVIKPSPDDNDSQARYSKGFITRSSDSP